MNSSFLHDNLPQIFYLKQNKLLCLLLLFLLVNKKKNFAYRTPYYISPPRKGNKEKERGTAIQTPSFVLVLLYFYLFFVFQWSLKILSMTQTVSTAFSSFPSKVRGGALTTSYVPLTLHAIRASVRILGVGIQVKLHLESINETTANQKVIMVYPVPLRWKLQNCVVQYDGQEEFTAMTQSGVFMTSDSASGRGTEWASSTDGQVWRVASQYIPWEMMVGTSIYAVATYYVPMSATPRCDLLDFTLPVELFPFMERPHQTVLYYNMLFQLKTPRVLKSGLTIEVEQGTLFQPLSGPVQLLRQGSVAGEETQITDDVLIEYRGDSSFSLHYYISQWNSSVISQSFVIRCPVTPTMEAVRVFAEIGTSDGEKERIDNMIHLQHNTLGMPAPSLTSPSLSVLDAAGKYAVCISLAPLRDRQYADQINAELIFVLDLHHVESAKAVAEGMRHVLPGLPETVYVNFVFPRDDKNDYAILMDGSQQLKTIDAHQITTYIEELSPQRPNTGTSRLSFVIQAILHEKDGKGSGKIPDGYCRSIIVLSDEGENKVVPHTEEELIRSAVQYAHKVRVSSVGLTFCGSAAVPFLHLLAHETYGVFEEAAMSSDVPEALVKVVAAVAVPTLTQIELSLSDESENQAHSIFHPSPSASPSFSSGKAITSISSLARCCFSTSRIPVIPLCHQRYFYLLLPSTFSSSSLQVIVNGDVGNMRAEFNADCTLGSSLPYTHPPPPSSSFHGGDVVGSTPSTSMGKVSSLAPIGLLHLAAAAARITYLVDPETGSRASLTGDAVKEAMELAFACSLPSPFTSLVVQPTTTDPVLRRQRQPAVVASSYVSTCALYSLIMEDHGRLLTAYDNPKKPLRCSEPPHAACIPLHHEQTEDFIRRLVLRIVTGIMDEEASVLRLLPLQRSDGSFPLNSLFSNCLQLKESVLMDAVPGNCEREEAWATAIALAAARALGSPKTILMERQAARYLRAASLECEVLDWSKWVTEATTLLRLLENKVE